MKNQTKTKPREWLALIFVCFLFGVLCLSIGIYQNQVVDKIELKKTQSDFSKSMQALQPDMSVYQTQPNIH